jgi:hypothetical protein
MPLLTDEGYPGPRLPGQMGPYYKPPPPTPDYELIVLTLVGLAALLILAVVAYKRRKAIAAFLLDALVASAVGTIRLRRYLGRRANAWATYLRDRVEKRLGEG